MQRHQAVDAIKGVAILLVMLGHCIVLNGLNETDPYIYDVIKSVQMPLFMLVSGVLASYSLHKYRQDRWYGIKKLPKRVVSYLLPFTSWFVVVYVWTHAWEDTLSLQSFLTEGKELFLEIVIVLKPVVIPAGIEDPVPDIHHVQKPPEFLFRQFKLHYDPLLSVNAH